MEACPGRAMADGLDVTIAMARTRSRQSRQLRLTGIVAWWVRRTYLFQMPRWDRRLRIVLNSTVALFFRADITRVDLRVEREQVKHARRLVEKSSG